MVHYLRQYGWLPEVSMLTKIERNNIKIVLQIYHIHCLSWKIKIVENVIFTLWTVFEMDYMWSKTQAKARLGFLSYIQNPFRTTFVTKKLKKIVNFKKSFWVPYNQASGIFLSKFSHFLSKFSHFLSKFSHFFADLVTFCD